MWWDLIWTAVAAFIAGGVLTFALATVVFEDRVESLFRGFDPCEGCRRDGVEDG